MAEDYESAKGMLELMSQRKKSPLVEGLRGLSMGMQGKLYEPEKEDTTAKDLLKAIMMERIKARTEAQDPYKQSQLAINQEIIKNLKGGGAEGGDLIWRDPSTGIEVPKEQALMDIQQGKQYIIKRRVASRTGVKEEDVSKPEDLTQEEKQYMITSKRVLGSLDALQNVVYPKLDKMGGNKDWQAFQAQGLPFAAIGNQDIQDYKSALTQLKSDIPFLRGGKQLTTTEAKRVDILLNPFGKTPETRAKDIKRFQDEFLSGAELMKGGMRELNRRVTPATPISGESERYDPLTHKKQVNKRTGETRIVPR